MKYYIETKVSGDFETAIDKATKALANEGFGVLTRINIHDKLKDKLNVDFRKYAILGACNPAFAYKALQNEDKIGTMLPCSVIVQETRDGKIEVAAVDPLASMQAVENPNLESIATEVKNKLANAINSI